MNPTIPSPVRIQCQVADRSSSERTAESERPKSLGDRLFQKLTNATPITSIPPASKPRTRQASVINAAWPRPSQIMIMTVRVLFCREQKPSESFGQALPQGTNAAAAPRHQRNSQGSE